jgi:hypothetical protein
MDTPFVYEIRVEGHLSDRWSTWFDGLTIQKESSRGTTLTGLLSDQAALYGVLAKIHNLNLVLVSVARVGYNENKPEDQSQLASSTGCAL